jgi:chaperonin GroES
MMRMSETKKKKLGLTPLWDNVILAPVTAETQTASGIIIPDSAKEKPSKFEVIAVGPGKINDQGKRDPMEVKVGDIVYCSRYAGDEFKINDVEYRVVHQDSILAIED